MGLQEIQIFGMALWSAEFYMCSHCTHKHQRMRQAIAILHFCNSYDLQMKNELKFIFLYR